MSAGEPDWLFQHPNPGVRYLALRDLAEGCDAAELAAARMAAHREGPIAVILEEMNPEGWWVEPGAGYNPKYRSTVWAINHLAQLGARVEEDERLGRAAAYVLDHALTPHGQFSANGRPAQTFDCLQGNLCWSLQVMGVVDERLEQAYDWMARSQTGEGIAGWEDRSAELRYTRSGKTGPGFRCIANNLKPCAWGAVKVMLAFSALPAQRRKGRIREAIDIGLDLLLGVDPLSAAYPTADDSPPATGWWKLRFPVFYSVDVLLLAEALVGLGLGGDARLQPLLDWIRSRQVAEGAWVMEQTARSPLWGDWGRNREANPWVSLRALRVLRAAGRPPAG